MESNDQNGLGISLRNMARFYRLTEDQTLIAEAAKILDSTIEELQEFFAKINQDEQDEN